MNCDCQKLAPVARGFYLFLKLKQKVVEILIFSLYRRNWQKFALNRTVRQIAAEFLLHCNSLNFGERNMQYHLRLMRNAPQPHWHEGE
jgi:hypothetical protein